MPIAASFLSLTPPPQVYFKELPAGQEVSLEYKFRIAPQVPTRDFSVAVHLVYEEMGAPSFYSSTVFNGTVEIVEKPRLVDTEGIFMYLMILGTTGLIGERRLLRVCGCVWYAEARARVDACGWVAHR
jgi:hypothetical protein